MLPKVNCKEDLKAFKEEIEEMTWIEVLENFTPHIDSKMRANIRRKFDMRMYVPAVSNSSSDVGLPNFQKAIRYAHEQNTPLHVFVQENMDGYMAAAYLGLQSVQAIGSTFGWNMGDTFDPANKRLPDLRYHPIDEVAPYDDLVLAMRREIHLIREGDECAHQEDEEKLQPDHVCVILGVPVPDLNKFLKDCRVYRKDRMRIMMLNPVVPSLDYEDLKERYGNDLEIVSYAQPTGWSAYQSLILSYNQRLQQGLDDPAWITSTKLPLFMQEAFRWLDRKHVCTWDVEKNTKMDPCMRGFFFYVGYRKFYNNIWWDKEDLLNNFVTLARWFAFRVRIETCGPVSTTHQWFHFLQFDHLAETFKISFSNLYACETEQMFVTMGWCHMVSLYEKAGLIIRDVDGAHINTKLNVGSETLTLPDHPVNVKQIELSDLDRSDEIAKVALFRYMVDYTAIRYVVATYTMTLSDKDVTVTTLIDRKKLPAKDKAFRRKERTITSSADLTYLFGINVPAEKYGITKETNYQFNDILKGLAYLMPNWYDLKPDWARKL